ncbi:MAG: hypothetical protein GY796_22160 [Chloroflexi bacterium]|nr:hypothetical protein [Chloroflexota bacterium]
MSDYSITQLCNVIGLIGSGYICELVAIPSNDDTAVVRTPIAHNLIVYDGQPTLALVGQGQEGYGVGVGR